MRIALGSDHRGFAVKQHIIHGVQQMGHEVVDVGTCTQEAVDYPDYAEKVALIIASGQADYGILICGTGVGMSIAANKVAGIRAAAVHDDVTAEISRRHNDSNILCLSAGLLSLQMIDQIVDIFLRTEFEGGRHERRLRKIEELEKRHLGREVAAEVRES